MRFVVPLGIFIVLVVVLAVGLKLDPRYIPSPLLDKPLPAFALTELANPAAAVTQDSLRGRAVVLNVWASWCSACSVEHPFIAEMANRGDIEFIGLNYKDTREDAAKWLAERGNPYKQIVFDPEGKLGLDLGVYGVPETFVIDTHGIIRHKHVGPLDAAAWARDFVPLLGKLRADKS